MTPYAKTLKSISKALMTSSNNHEHKKPSYYALWIAAVLVTFLLLFDKNYIVPTLLHISMHLKVDHGGSTCVLRSKADRSAVLTKIAIFTKTRILEVSDPCLYLIKL